MMKTNKPYQPDTCEGLQELQSIIDEKRENKQRAIKGLQTLHKTLITKSYTDITLLKRLKESGKLLEMLEHITDDETIVRRIEKMNWVSPSKTHATVHNLRSLYQEVQTYIGQLKNEIQTLDELEHDAQHRLRELETHYYKHGRQLKTMLDMYHLKPLKQILDPESWMTPEQELDTFIRQYSEIDSHIQKLKDIKYDRSITKTKKREAQSEYSKRLQHL